VSSYTLDGSDFLGAEECARAQAFLARMTKLPNRFVIEVRHGVALFFNRPANVEDGWWWGDDADPFQWGPFESWLEALADACHGGAQFKLVRWNRAELWGPDRPLPPTGYVVVVDTGGKLWVKSGESVRPGWTPR